MYPRLVDECKVVVDLVVEEVLRFRLNGGQDKIESNACSEGFHPMIGLEEIPFTFYEGVNEKTLGSAETRSLWANSDALLKRPMSSLRL